ncbi:MAG TPA: transposase [Syntrophomonadaceae bacterium]|nr:transposase [Syntrophomonadaceae bacterium]
MSKTRQRYDEEFKKNAVKLSYASSKTVKEVAGDLGISVSLLYRWRKKYTPEGEKTQFAMMEEENRALKLENAELKIERDMLKKAAAYFAKNQKLNLKKNMRL